MAEQRSILDVARESGALQDEEPKSILDVAREGGLDPGVNATPIPVERSHKKTFGGTRSVPAFTSTINTPDWKTTAADNGIMFDNPAPAGHYLSGFAANEEQRAHAFAKSLSEHYGRDIRVRTGPATGRLEWLDPKHARWSLVDPPGWNKGDLANMVGPAISVGLETAILGVVMGGGVVTGGISAAALGVPAGAVAALAGEGTRIAIGVKLGINQDIDEAKVSEHLLEVGATAGKWGLAGEIGFRIGKRMVGFMMGRTTSQQLLDDVRKLRRQTLGDTDVPDEYKRAVELQESVEGRLREGLADEAERLGYADLDAYLDAVEVEVAHRQFAIRLDQATMNENLLTFGEVLRKDATFADLFKFQEKQQKAALERYFTLINRPFKTVTQREGGNRAVGQNVQSYMQGQVDNAVAAQDQFVAAKAAELRALTTGLTSTPLESAGEPFRFIVGKQDDALRRWADETTDQLATLTGNQEIISIRRTANLANEMADKEKRALFKSQKEEYKRIIGERRMETTTEQGGLILDGNILSFDEIQAEKAIDALYNPDSVLTFQDAWDALKSLKRLKRSMKADPSEPYNEKAITDLIDALESDLAEGMPDAAKELYDTFRVQYRAETNRLRRGIVGNFMAKDPQTGQYIVENAKVFDAIFTPGGTRNAEQLFNAISDSSQHMDITRKALVDHWKRAVDLKPDGTFNRGAHRRWMDNHRKQAEIFLDSREMAALKKGAGVQDALNARIANRKEAIKRINESLPARVANYKEPAMIVNDMLVPGNHQFAADVMHVLNDMPFPPDDLIREIRSAARARVVDLTTNAQGADLFEISPTKLKNLLFGNEQAGSGGAQKGLRAIFGDQYVDDLVTLHEALKISQARPGASNFSNTAPAAKAVMDMTRAYVGLFTTAGRVVTAANRVRGRAANRALVSAIADPGNLRQLMEITSTSRGHPPYVAFLTQVGALGMLTPDEFTEEDYGKEVNGP